MLLNPMVTVSSPKRHDQEAATENKTRVYDQTTDDYHQTMDEKSHVEHVARTETQNDFTSFLNDIPTREPPILEAPIEKLSPQARRQLKAELFLEYQNRNPDFRYCPIILSLEESSLEEIQTAVEFVRRKKDHENTKGNVKNLMVMGAQGVVAAVNSYNLVGCDMSQWGKDFAYELNSKNDYDDLLDELIRQYRNKLEMPIELKLVLAVGGSFVKGVMTQREIMKLEARAEEELRRKLAARDAERERVAEQEQVHAANQHFTQHVPQHVPQHVSQQQQQQQQNVQDALAEQIRSFHEQQIRTAAVSEPAALLFDGPARTAVEMRELLKEHLLDDDDDDEEEEDQKMMEPMVIQSVQVSQPKIEELVEEEGKPKRKGVAKPRSKTPKKKSKDEDEDEMVLAI
jgi:hypothetical protein